jgi:hypothetical protein
MFAHILTFVLCASILIVPILVLHYYDLKSTPKSYEVNHKTCKYVSLDEEVARKQAPDAAETLGKFLGELLTAAAAKHNAA